MSHLYVGVLSVGPLGGERQIQKVHQVVVAISKGFEAVIRLNHLEYIHIGTFTFHQTDISFEVANRKKGDRQFSVYNKLNTPGATDWGF